VGFFLVVNFNVFIFLTFGMNLLTSIEDIE
jgi:hypothetical protein